MKAKDITRAAALIEQGYQPAETHRVYFDNEGKPMPEPSERFIDQLAKDVVYVRGFQLVRRPLWRRILRLPVVFWKTWRISGGLCFAARSNPIPGRPSRRAEAEARERVP